MKKKGAPRPRLVGEQPQMKENKHVRMFPGVQAYKVLIIYIRVPSTGRCVCVHTYMYVFIFSIFIIYWAQRPRFMLHYFMEYVMLKVFFIIDPCPGPKLALDRALLR